MTAQTLTAGVITLFPDMFDALTLGITGRAQKSGLLSLHCWNPRTFTEDKHRTVDDRPYGGGPGMVMMAEPLTAAIRAAKAELGEQTKVIYLSPQGRTLDQAGVETLSQERRLIFLAGRYEGVDQRVIDQEIDEQWSLGDYVISGGELAAMVFIDALTRQLPGALGHESSASEDSFADGLLDYPHYTRPEQFDGLAVPPVLLSGDHKAIARWRLKQALGQTWLNRPDCFEQRTLNALENELLNEFMQEYERSNS